MQVVSCFENPSIRTIQHHCALNVPGIGNVMAEKVEASCKPAHTDLISSLLLRGTAKIKHLKTNYTYVLSPRLYRKDNSNDVEFGLSWI